MARRQGLRSLLSLLPRHHQTPAWQPHLQPLASQHNSLLCGSSSVIARSSGYASAAAAAAGGSDASSSDGSATPSQQQQSQSQQQEYPPLYAACVLERLPILKSPPPAWEAEYKAWQQLQQLASHELKQYPTLDSKQQQQRDAAGKEDAAAAAAASAAASSSTAADASGAVNTMKRRLHDKLVLLVKAKHNTLISSAAAATAAAKQQQPPAGWTFPHTSHQPGESMRQAAERALKEAIGQSQVYFVGNAPMAHLDLAAAHDGDNGSSVQPAASSSISSKQTQQQDPAATAAAPAGRVFFHLAQVVNDPWEVQLAEGGAASEFAWVAKEELGAYLQDAQLLKLAQCML